MANLTETATYDAGVYQLETTDPVQGGPAGVSNYQGKNLANRTAYLKQRVDNLENGTTVPTGIATLASPAFTGNPTVPTAALGDNDTTAASTAFVQATVGGRLVKSVAGGVNVTLTAVEAGNAILEFTGVITANISVIVPTSPTRSWIIKNSTTGSFTLTVKTAAGTGAVCVQSKSESVFTDGTNVYPVQTDYDSIAITGTPTAPTATPGTNTTQLATTAFVAALGALKADLASPTFTGTPAAPTATAGTNTTQLATTAFVTSAVSTASNTAVQKDSNTGAASLPSGTIAQRPTATAGRLRFNSETGRFEGANGTGWGSLGGATGGGTDAVFYQNDQTVSNNYTVPANQNAMSAGPIAVANGVTVTVSNGGVWTIV